MNDRSSGGSNLISRRHFLVTAAAMGATASWAKQKASPSRIVWVEMRDRYPEGVASGDPDPHSVLLWTRHPATSGSTVPLLVEVAEDNHFQRVIATANLAASASADWTIRVLVGNLEPARIYWYRFTDHEGHGSRVGRTITAPATQDSRSVKFAVVCCQNINLGSQHAYRRMIFEDEQAAESERLGFVLHLGDFIYDIVCYPEDHPDGIWGRMPLDTIRYPQGEKIGKFHIPASLEDYRAIYRAYLHDPDIQDARARWPFVPIWDNHEFSGGGWQSLQVLQGKTRPAQTRKVSANQAWFEFQPARVKKSGGPTLDRFNPPEVHDTPITQFDDHGLGQEPNNLAALQSLTGYRTLRWGKHVALMITDQRSYRSEQPSARPEAKPLWSADFPKCIPQEILETIDAGRTYAGGKPPETLRLGRLAIENFRRDEPAQTILGWEQKHWLMDRLKESTATWKIWGNTTGTLDRRVDPQNLPAGLTVPWPGTGYATYEDGDHGSAYSERAEIYSLIRHERITGFVTVAGDRHSFWAGVVAPTLPPKAFEPVGVAFIAASISMCNSADLLAAELPSDHPLRPLYLKQNPGSGAPEPVVNMLIRHGVRSCLEYAHSGDVDTARRLSNPELAPHLKFVDFSAYGFATVRATNETLECEFVCIPPPTRREAAQDGGPLLYRVVHRTKLWNKGETPRLEQLIVEGNPKLSI
jgi:alkaline phosphatase D